MKRRCVKFRYKSEEAARKGAELDARAVRVTRGLDQKPLRVYACPKCRGWHLTSKEQR